MASPRSPNNGPSESQIVAFWQWFEAIADELGRDFDREELRDELDRRISALGDLSWELGPGVRDENALVITPDGSSEWLPVTRRIVARAPRVQGWEFHYARPPRTWDLQFSLEAEGGGVLEVDARPWRYVLFKFPDGTFDIVLEQNNLFDAGESDRYAAATVLIDGMLGESTRLDVIGSIEAVLSLTPEQIPKATPIDRLAKHVDSLLPRKGSHRPH